MEKKSDHLLSNQEILGGLNSAIKRGGSLKDAMMTFYQAGYDKVEIEEAARALLNQQKSVPVVIKSEKEKKVKTEEKKEFKQSSDIQASASDKKASPSPSSPAPKKGTGVVPKHVSSYEDKEKPPKKPKSNIITIILIFALLISLGVLAAVFLFKENLVNFINGLLA